MSAAAKPQRQRMIADWLRSGRVGSQEEIVARLGLAGVAATQATVSRDLDELGAVKLKREGAIRYLLPETIDPAHAAAKLDRLLAEWVTDVVTAGPLVVLRTPPGSANLVANALDSAALGAVAGTIAGDDTIFVAVADGHRAADVAALIEARRARG
ncbi:arginine repressor [Sphingomonas sp. ASV193]|uniref:arginine repressor n=1 Tax=Sphingomonas sp. ASV193 TaxID=3144405 RepID=UPI0032E8C597